MPLYVTAEYRVNSAAVDKVRKAVEEFTAYVRASEPGTRLYEAWQRQDDPTRFIHFFIFENEAAQEIHSASKEVKRFEAIYAPELADGPVVFTGHRRVASNVNL